uniref:Coagulation factor IX n=1 Tax=Sphaeramia orbicularis TaxID=375764 RepID=A0A673A121_9TELE
SGSVFLSQQSAHTVLRRQRRYNSGKLEEVLYKANLERECREEVCNMEEAREWFENDEKTMEFWAGYIDGNQCDPPPCQNGGVCTDGVNSYVCWCKQAYSGKNCEIEVAKQCSFNNGGCSHFCVMRGDQAMCQCAYGYRLLPDRKSCEPTGLKNITNNLTTAALTQPTNASERIHNSSDALQDEIYDSNATYLYDYYELARNDSDPYSDFDVPAVDVRSAKSDPITYDGAAVSVTDIPTEREEIPAWAFPTLPTIVATGNVDQKIVGGTEAIRGEFPWQVALMSRSHPQHRALPFCGGSLLTEVWVITAAHCLTELNNAKKGEHDVLRDEGPERDYMVEEQHVHPLYNHEKSLYNHDIALLKLASPVELSRERRPICLGPKDFTENLLRDASTSMVSGWGRLKFQGPEATKLQKLAVPYVDRTTCKQSSREQVTRYMFCAGYRTQQMDSCQGDSGGPHATEYKGTWFLTGIVSWGEECAMDGKYGIYTRVSRYYPWISHKTGIRVDN